jgi:hypothetical protein
MALNSTKKEEVYIRKEMLMGLGEAIKRHNLLHKTITAGVATQVQRDEYELITEALNKIELPLGFDCDDDGIPDTVEIFAKTAKTSCCRIIHGDKNGFSIHQ